VLRTVEPPAEAPRLPVSAPSSLPEPQTEAEGEPDLMAEEEILAPHAGDEPEAEVEPDYDEEAQPELVAEPDYDEEGQPEWVAEPDQAPESEVEPAAEEEQDIPESA
jgi:pilus assembly protein FimV